MTIAERRRLRAAIVGYGFISEHGHVPAYRRPGGTEFEIVAVADGCAARREKARAEIPGARVYGTYGELLMAERANLDFVDVTTPPCDHAAIAQAALGCGLHVLCEKPLATRVDDARAMVAAARKNRRVLFPCHNYVHAPVVKAVRRVLDEGLIGRPNVITLQTFRTTHAKGVDEWRRDWRRERRYSGGGIAMDHGSHTFYLAFDWFGEYPTDITAKMSTLGAYDTEDNFSCVMSFPGGTATATLSWTAGVRKVIYTIHGDKGAVRVEDDDVEVAVRAASNGPADVARWETRSERVASAWMDASHVGWFRSLLDDFASAIAREDHVSRTTEASTRCVELITQAYASAQDRSREHALVGWA